MRVGINVVLKGHRSVFNELIRGNKQQSSRVYFFPRMVFANPPGNAREQMKGKPRNSLRDLVTGFVIYFPRLAVKH